MFSTFPLFQIGANVAEFLSKVVVVDLEKVPLAIEGKRAKIVRAVRRFCHECDLTVAAKLPTPGAQFLAVCPSPITPLAEL